MISNSLGSALCCSLSVSWDFIPPKNDLRRISFKNSDGVFAVSLMEPTGSSKDLLLLCFKKSDAFLVLGSATTWTSHGMPGSSPTLPAESGG